MRTLAIALLALQPAAAADLIEARLPIANVADYEERLPPCYWAGGCNDVHEVYPLPRGVYQAPYYAPVWHVPRDNSRRYAEPYRGPKYYYRYR